MQLRTRQMWSTCIPSLIGDRCFDHQATRWAPTMRRPSVPLQPTCAYPLAFVE